MYDVLIIGGGPAALSAAMYAGRLKLNTVVLAGLRGGTVVNTNEITNWPGIKTISGFELARQLEEHAKEYGVAIKDSFAKEIKRKDDGHFVVLTVSGETYEGKSLIIATGTDVRKLGVKGEAEFQNRGVHYCALCDGFFYTDKVVAVVGGSDSAVKEALLLTQWAKKVYIIYRRDKLRAEPANLDKLKENNKIEVITNTNIIEIRGNENGVNEVVLDRPFNGNSRLSLDGVFVEIGRIPNNGLAKQLGVNFNENGEIITDKEGKTNVNGVFAAGDITNLPFKQAITAAAEGVIAAHSAYEYLQKREG
ncbi:MAG: FAD-dependent oxidoreductase [Candidatus Bilamarchaeaceae archaeon]